MTPADQALQLASAKLTDEEMQAVEELDKMIDAHIHKGGMEWRGFEFTGKETRFNVLAEISRRLREAKYNLELKFIGEQNRFNAAAAPTLTGFKLHVFPTDEAYKEFFRSLLS